MDNITRVAKSLREGAYIASPHQCAEDKAILAGEFAWVMSQLENVLQKKPSVWGTIRLQTKSDTSAEKVWQASEDGINEIGLRLRAKSIEKMMSALGTLVSLAERESKNLL